MKGCRVSLNDSRLRLKTSRLRLNDSRVRLNDSHLLLKTSRLPLNDSRLLLKTSRVGRRTSCLRLNDFRLIRIDFHWFQCSALEHIREALPPAPAAEPQTGDAQAEPGHQKKAEGKRTGQIFGEPTKVDGFSTNRPGALNACPQRQVSTGEYSDALLL